MTIEMGVQACHGADTHPGFHDIDQMEAHLVFVAWRMQFMKSCQYCKSDIGCPAGRIVPALVQSLQDDDRAGRSRRHRLPIRQAGVKRQHEALADRDAACVHTLGVKAVEGPIGALGSRIDSDHIEIDIALDDDLSLGLAGLLLLAAHGQAAVFGSVPDPDQGTGEPGRDQGHLRLRRKPPLNFPPPADTRRLSSSMPDIG